MPNLDGGHYFYTGLFPVRLDSVQRPDGSYTVPSHLLREALASLPNFSEAAGSIRTSPFSRCHSTHFARLAVIDEPEFNGRDPVDALVQAAKSIDLLAHQPVDHFSRAWLIFTADFDAVDEGARDRWAAGLWDLMESELRAIFGHCETFDEVKDGAGFAAWLARGQVETTMSFNDYWIDPLPFPSLSVGAILGTMLGVLAILLGLGWLVHRQSHHWWVWAIAALLGIAAGLWAAFRLVTARGRKPFPTAPDSDLKSVLKGLYLQQNLVRFAIEHQGDSPEDLHAAFGQFLGRTQPANVDQPTQKPGVLQA
jgi:hypothetical protein